MAKHKVSWGGNFPALVTPFTAAGAVDVDRLAQLVDLVIGEGVSGIVVAGHQGEFWLLSDEERRMVFQVAVQAARGRVVVIAGTSDISAAAAVAQTMAAREAGADGALLLPPLHADATGRDLLAFYERVSAEGGLPILVYNYPPATGVNLTPLLPELAGIANVVAVKQSSSDFSDLVHTLHHVGDRLRVFSGLAAYRGVAAVAMGVVGFVSSADVNVLGREAISLWDLAIAGDLERARQVQFRTFRLVSGLHDPRLGNSYAAIKTAMNVLGRPGGATREPHQGTTPEEERHIRELLRGLGLLG